ncbi:hypothetical protein IJX73_04775 [bacterium]|nr:hypothetical protein [bacterium]
MNKIWGLILALIFSLNAAFALSYDYSDTEFVNIPLSPLKPILSNGDIYEGQEIQLKVKKNIFCHGCLLVKKGTIATARIETIVTKGMNGFPAEIIIDNFKIDGINDSQLMSTYYKAGKNFALLVYPIKWALTPIPFVGSLTNLIHGTNVRIDTDDVIVIKYFPHWK